MSLERKKVFGFDFISARRVEDIAATIVGESMRSQTPEVLITPNAHQTGVLLSKEYPRFRPFFSRSRYVLPDGMPLVWLSKLKGQALQSRLTGSDLFPVFWAEVKQQQAPVTMILPSEEIAARFRAEYPLCSCIVPGFFSADDEVYIRQLADLVADSISAHASRFVFIGLGIPKQELLTVAVHDEMERRSMRVGVLFLLLGASFEFYFGTKKRAPGIYQRTGLEWLYRFAQEPRRLWKRYTVDNFRFVMLALKEWIKPAK